MSGKEERITNIAEGIFDSATAGIIGVGVGALLHGSGVGAAAAFFMTTKTGQERIARPVKKVVRKCVQRIQTGNK